MEEKKSWSRLLAAGSVAYSNGGRILEATGVFKELLLDEPEFLELEVESLSFGLHVGFSLSLTVEGLKEEIETRGYISWRELRPKEWEKFKASKPLWSNEKKS